MSKISSRTNVIPDDYPVRPSSTQQNEIQENSSRKENLSTTVILCLTYFLYGCGISIYGPLYSKETERNGFTSTLYGPVMGVSFLVSAVLYPVACRMAASVVIRMSSTMGLFLVGGSRILFGTLSRISSGTFYSALSFSIQIVEGFGTAIILASTFVIMFSKKKDSTKRKRTGMQEFLTLGIIIGPICGKPLADVLNFSVPFYGIGVLTILNAICAAIVLPEPVRRLSYKEMHLFSWIKNLRLLLYFFIIFATFYYIGFLSVTLASLLKQFHLDSIFIGLMFSISPFAYGLTAPGWLWLSKKGVNSVLLTCIASFLIFGSLILIAPASFITSEQSLSNVSAALLLHGLGTAGKLACVAYTIQRDLRKTRSYAEVAGQISFLVFLFGSTLGYASGTVTTGFTDFYLGVRKATYILFGLEAVSVAAAFIFAFKRNYRSPTHPGAAEERQPILEH